MAGRWQTDDSPLTVKSYYRTTTSSFLGSLARIMERREFHGPGMSLDGRKTLYMKIEPLPLGDAGDKHGKAQNHKL